ncbi:hypothetical protein BsWGS_00828 [Bradybaena similaris]
MAANVLTTAAFVLLTLFVGLLCTAETASHIQYQVADTNEPYLSPDSELSLKFAPHSHERVRRQSNINGSHPQNSDINANSARVPETQGTTLSDKSNQRESNASDGSSTNASAVTSTNSTVLTPRSSAGLFGLPNMESSNNGSEDNPFEDADIIHDYYEYYTSDTIQNRLSEHWVELENAPRHETLSKGHRLAAVVSLKFDFYFYGHKVTNVTVATGGFIYMSPFLHQWLTATQYIAPLMANFDPSLDKDSSIYQRSDKNKLIVEWKNIMLKDQASGGKFHFQTILSKDGSIKFAYKSVPLPVINISTQEHPVKVGLSDAYYNDTYIPEYKIKRRTIYEYHKVALPMSSVSTGSVIILTPLQTCNRLTDCASCTSHVGMKFDCRWCNTIGRCSDGLDWYRQHWDREGCQSQHTKDATACSALPAPPKPLTDPLHSSSVVDPCMDGKCKKREGFPVVVIVILVVIICGMLAAVASWVLYAYRNPTSRSGIWLMEHRPGQFGSKIKFWKSSSDGGTKYKVESET